jgi:hypothetical protein
MGYRALLELGLSPQITRTAPGKEIDFFSTPGVPDFEPLPKAFGFCFGIIDRSSLIRLGKYAHVSGFTIMCHMWGLIAILVHWPNTGGELGRASHLPGACIMPPITCHCHWCMGISICALSL